MALAVLAASVGPQLARAEIADYQATSDFLKISGTQFSFGLQTVVLKGENFHNDVADPCDLPGDSTQINVNAADSAQLAGFGANHVRFDISWGWYNTNPAQFFQIVDQHVLLAKQNHLWMYEDGPQAALPHPAPYR